MWVVGLAIAICGFSVVHKSQRLDPQRQGFAFAAMHHFMLKRFPYSLRSQINLEGSVSDQ